MAEILTIRKLIKDGADLDDEIELWYGDEPSTSERIPGPDVSTCLYRKRITISFPRQDENPEEDI